MSSKYVTQAEAPNRSETNKYLNASGHWTVPSGGGGGGGTASDIEYDNTTSGLTAENVQDAIDEIAQGGGGSSDERAMISDAWNPSTNYTVGRYAIDGNKLYRCIVANINMQPSTNPTYWEKTNVGDELPKYSEKIVSANGLTFKWYKYGKIVMGNITGQTTIALSSTTIIATIPDEFLPTDSYTHDFAVTINNSWSIAMAYIHQSQYIRCRNNIDSGMYVRGTICYLTE